ncbi:hypothetical protein I656_04171 [Geobacillus sp. WSUCF1]|nr:hypothetical protein I656_04171 [Geobacillus sp. WSUCF1]
MMDEKANGIAFVHFVRRQHAACRLWRSRGK